MAQDAVPRGSETILLVAPDPETRKLVAFMLAKQGYRVLEARNTSEALQHYHEQSWEVDLLLTELISEVNGPELARVLEAKDPRLRVVYLSDAGGRRWARRLDPRGKVVLVERPFTMRLLASKIRQSLDAPQRPQAAAVRGGAA